MDGVPSAVIFHAAGPFVPDTDAPEGTMSDDKPRDDAVDGGPATAEGVSQSAVGALMEERRQYETWLSALEARRATTPKHVFTRVHADYTARLEAVVTRLVTHADGLRAELTSLSTRLATLDEQQHRARDERAEAELRAHVGELSPDSWKDIAASSDAAIALLEAQRSKADEELRRTRELLADAERPPTPVQAAQPQPTEAVPATPAAIEPDASETSEALETSIAAATTEKAAEVPVQEPTASPAESSPAQAELQMTAPASPPGLPQAPKNGAFDELAFLQSVVEPSPLPPRTVPPPPLPRREAFTAKRADEKIVKGGESSGPTLESGQGRSLAANISGNNPIVLRDKTVEAAKTLKCSECGAMNYPTEWYCERCGAELASL
jgi:hypothetical protein